MFTQLSSCLLFCFDKRGADLSLFSVVINSMQQMLSTKVNF